MNMSEQIWNDFETRFENAFDSFYTALLEKFPGLTPNERKLCALLRSGLSSKDIAMLTFQNPQSVDVARYRLRKKLNLVNDENLIDFLLRIDK
jgi:DNA-binding CsgD family transcriptional regulator